MTTNVRVYLDENSLEFCDEAIRCGFIVSEDETGREDIHHDLIDSRGYRHLTELLRDVAAIFGISPDLIMVA